jgi:signal transduction histidine kinase
LVFLINAAVFGAGGAFLFRAQLGEERRHAEERTADLLYTLKGTIRTEADLNVAYILQWPYWNSVEDAILVDRGLYRPDSGGIRTPGIALNPVGSLDRPADFDEEAALSAILRAMETRSPIGGVEGGRAVPIEGERDLWGGLWYRAQVRVDRLGLFRRLFPWFLLSTLLLTAGTFLFLRGLVLDPVRQLADGARRVREGDLTVRLAEPERTDELSDLVRSFNAMTGNVQGFNERLSEEVRRATEKARQAEAAAMTQRRLAAMGELAAGIAHEINNPLGGLQNAVVSLERADLPPEKRSRYLGLLESGLQRIAETVSRLRRFTPREASAESVDLVAVVQDAIELVSHRAARLGVRIVLSGAPSLVVRGAQNDLGQALLNVLANALDALEEAGSVAAGGPAIEVRVEAEEDGGRVVVRDNGPGVSREELARVADLFYTTKEVGKGTGLGLALVHNAMRRHGGRVKLESEEGRSFQVELWLPTGETPS